MRSIARPNTTRKVVRHIMGTRPPVDWINVPHRHITIDVTQELEWAVEEGLKPVVAWAQEILNESA
jgi:hypothetical protein